VTLVVKYGGNAMPAGDRPDELFEEIAQLWREGQRIVLVHGGGPEIDRALAQHNLGGERIDGMRVTSAQALGIVESVLCATLNKRIVRALSALGLPAAGISGQDGATLIARRERGTTGADLGYVGRVVSSDPRLVRTLLDGGFLPVISPVAVAHDSMHAYNVNADLAAAAIASAVGARALVLVTNVARVRRDPDDPESGIDRLGVAQAVAFAASTACRSSMKPKVAAAAAAVAGGSAAAYICEGRPGAIRAALCGDATVIGPASRALTQ
jgi:acetylglutamate kinase